MSTVTKNCRWTECEIIIYLIVSYGVRWTGSKRSTFYSEKKAVQKERENLSGRKCIVEEILFFSFPFPRPYSRTIITIISTSIRSAIVAMFFFVFFFFAHRIKQKISIIKEGFFFYFCPKRRPLRNNHVQSRRRLETGEQIGNITYPCREYFIVSSDIYQFSRRRHDGG